MFNLYGLLNITAVKAKQEIGSHSTISGSVTVDHDRVSVNQEDVAASSSKSAAAAELLRKVLLNVADVEEFKRQFAALKKEELRQFFASVDERGRNPIHLAALAYNPDLCKLFLSKATSEEKNAVDADGNPPLYMIAYNFEGVDEGFKETYALLREVTDDQVKNREGKDLKDLFKESGFDYNEIFGVDDLIDQMFEDLDTESNPDSSYGGSFVRLDTHGESLVEGFVELTAESIIKGINHENVSRKEQELIKFLGVNDAGTEGDFIGLAQEEFMFERGGGEIKHYSSCCKVWNV